MATQSYHNLKRWSRPANYFGATWPDYFSAGVGQSRDSDELEQSNFAVMLRELGYPSSETVLVVCESHWAVGWVEWIAIHQDDHTALETANRLIGKLADYPVLDEMDLSEREWNAQCETWHNYSLRDRIEVCKRCGISIFAARRNELPQDDDGRLGEYLVGR